MSSQSFIARNLAAAFLAGAWSLDALVRRGTEALGRRGRWLRPLVRRLLMSAGAANARPDHDALARWIESEPAFHKCLAEFGHFGQIPLRRLYPVVPRMAPAAGAPTGWPVLALATAAALAGWLDLDDRELHWLADCHGREADAAPGPLSHYTYHRVQKANGRRRVLEAPKPRLKAVQRRILHGILDHLPPHEAVHSYRRGRSLAGFVAPHAGRSLVLRLDLRDFFPSLRASRVHALFRTAGYPLAVVRLLTGLCTNTAPPDAWREAEDQGCRDRLRSPHVPQGAPTSPALANLCAYRLDCRLSALAGVGGARYTRYADDLAFSGDEALERVARRFHVAVCRIALEEGFEVHTRKTRFMRQGVRQQLAGVVLNVRPNVRRARYDELKAILTNCVRHGPHGQTAGGGPISAPISEAASLTSPQSTRREDGDCCGCSSGSTGASGPEGHGARRGESALLRWNSAADQQHRRFPARGSLLNSLGPQSLADDRRVEAAGFPGAGAHRLRGQADEADLMEG